MNAGDELALRFAAPPPPPAGWVRDYVIAGDGWMKDGDYNSTFSRTVQPLPYHARSEYDTPPGALEDEWVYRHHPAGLAELSNALCDRGYLSQCIAQRDDTMKKVSNCANPRHSLLCIAARGAVDDAPFLCSGKDQRQSRRAGRTRSLWFLASGSCARGRHRFCSPGAHARLEARRHHARGRVDGRVGLHRRLRSRRLARHLRDQQRHRQQESSLPQQSRRHVYRCCRAIGHRRREPTRHRRLNGRGVGRLRQRRLRGSLPHQVGQARAISQRPGQTLHARERTSRAAAVDQRQHRRLVRLRPRWQARSLRRRLLS